MTEYQTSPEQARIPVAPRVTLDQLSVTDNDPEIVARWDEGLREWRDAFVAYTTLGRAELHTADVLVHFEKKYIVSLGGIEEVVDDHLRIFGWTDALRRFRYDQSISEELLRWDYDAVARQIRVLYDLVELEGRIHVFAK